VLTELTQIRPDSKVSVRSVFGIDSDLVVPAFSERDDHVPEVDDAYRFNPDVTLAILAGFARDRRVMIQGLHGSGKSTHIEQVAARLNWPCLRVNLDAHISRLDLVGRDAIVLRDGQQVTEFQGSFINRLINNTDLEIIPLYFSQSAGCVYSGQSDVFTFFKVKRDK